MQEDVHFYCIAVVARAAGFAPEDALTLAYASQYVDDATEDRPIQVGDVTFHPVRSAYYFGPELFNESTARNVWLPFHFLPPGPLPEHRTLVTSADSPLSSLLLEEAGMEEEPMRRLCRIGVALHTYADTFSHEGFSGRWHVENEVEELGFLEGDEWNDVSVFDLARLWWAKFRGPKKRGFEEIMPKIGHAEAWNYPDMTQVTWKYRPKGGGEVTHDNLERTLKAARGAHAHLCLLRGSRSGRRSRPLWDAIEGLLASPELNLTKRCAAWQRTFGRMFSPYDLFYDKLAWREEALRPKARASIQWDDFDPEARGRLEFDTREGFQQSRWVRFHEATKAQRQLVLSRVFPRGRKAGPAGTGT